GDREGRPDPDGRGRAGPLRRPHRGLQGAADRHLHGRPADGAIGQDPEDGAGLTMIGAARPQGIAAVRGTLAGVAAATIWSGWYVLARHGVTAGGMDPWDLAALRFAVAAPLLLLILRRLPF